MAPIVAGVDSSTQSVKVLLCDAESGEIRGQVSRPHPEGTEINPEHWNTALTSALEEASSLASFDAISIGGQQHGMVALDASGTVIRDALLWNDTRSDVAAHSLNAEFPDIAARTGSQLVASFTASKVRWMAESEPDKAAKVSAIALPHDWLSWKLSASTSITDIFTDRSDASGTGYFNPVTNEYDREIFSACIGTSGEIYLPRIIQPSSFGGYTSQGIPIAAGCGDNAGAALGVNAQPGDMVISLGTSGTAFISTPVATHDTSGEVAGFADATGNFLPLACTLNAAKIFDTTATMLGLNFSQFSALALSAPFGSEGLRLIPHFDGERTPNKPHATGSFTGITHKNFTPANIARASIEGVMSGLRYASEAIEKLGVPIHRVLLVGGAARNEAVQSISATLFPYPITVPEPGEYVARGAARQAAWAFSGVSEIPQWAVTGSISVAQQRGPFDLYAEYRELIK